MKKIILLLFMFFHLYNLFSLDLSGKHFIDDVWMGFNENGHNQRGSQRISFDETTLYHQEKINDGSTIKQDYLYNVETVDGINFINLVGNNGEQLRWLMLYSDDILILYDNDDFPFFFGSNRAKFLSMQFAAMFPGVGDLIKVSSELSETINGTVVTYSAMNMGLVKIPYPWVEGVEGNGVGEIFHFGTGEYNERYPSEKIYYFSNGYVSYNRPDLYKANGRIKKILVTQPRNNETRTFDFPDTPNLQRLFMDIDMDGDDLIFEILDVYPGEKYLDTCINYMFYFQFY